MGEQTDVDTTEIRTKRTLKIERYLPAGRGRGWRKGEKNKFEHGRSKLRIRVILCHLAHNVLR